MAEQKKRLARAANKRESAAGDDVAIGQFLGEGERATRKKLTVEIDAELIRELKRFGLDSDTPLWQLVERYCRDGLEGERGG